MTLPPAASVSTGLIRPRGQGCAQLPLCDQPRSRQTGYSTTKGAAQQGYWRSDDALTLLIPFHYGCGRLPQLRTTTHHRLRWSAYVWSPPPESNRRPHPYHGSAAKRRANPSYRRPQRTVSGVVMGSVVGLEVSRPRPLTDAAPGSRGLQAAERCAKCGLRRSRVSVTAAISWSSGPGALRSDQVASSWRGPAGGDWPAARWPSGRDPPSRPGTAPSAPQPPQESVAVDRGTSGWPSPAC
jgi:hypothetical protein